MRGQEISKTVPEDMALTIVFEPGAKGPGDMKVIWNGIQVTFMDMAEIVNQLCKNEDIIYPKPKYRGGQMLIDFMQEVYDNGEITDDICQRYRLGKYKPNALTKIS